jgi:hypothetical protein
MARQKRIAVERTPSDLYFQTNGTVHIDNTSEIGHAVSEKPSIATAVHQVAKQHEPGLGSLIFCVGGIYASLYDLLQRCVELCLLIE